MSAWEANASGGHDEGERLSGCSRGGRCSARRRRRGRGERERGELLFPGAFGSFLVAVPPEPGFSVGSQTLIFGGNAQKSVLNGRQTFGINAFAVYEYLAGCTPSSSRSWGAACRSASPCRW